MWSKLITPASLVALVFLQVTSFLQEVNYSNFIAHHFHYLNVDQVRSNQVLSAIECAHACLREVSCFSVNLEASPNVDGKLWCELLASDKYNSSDKLEASLLFHHFSILNRCLTTQCKNGGKCVATFNGFECHCPGGVLGTKCETVQSSCSAIKSRDPSSTNGSYVIDPDGAGGLAPFSVFCDMSDKAGVGVTVISHDSEDRTLVDGCERKGCYSRDVTYTGASLAQLANLTKVSSHCEQFIKYECYHARIMQYGFSWLVSRDGKRMSYWGGAPPNSSKCACGVNNSCANRNHTCNCDKNDRKWREDSGLLTYKSDLPLSQLRFGDVLNNTRVDEKGYHTLGKLKCYGIV